MNRLGQVTDRARQMLAGFTTGQRAIVLVAVLALGLGAYGLARWAAQPTWAVLFANVSPENASAITDQLTTDGVKYQYANGGSTILVPQQQAMALRVKMAGKGLTTGNDGGGWSVLDRQGMTATDLQQNVAVQRALQSELGRTLTAINGVRTAIVHLAIPKKDVFTTETDRPTASVLLALTPGTTLGRAQIRSVTHLVAASVPGLTPSDVTVTDAEGNLLSVREDGQAGAIGAASEADQQTQAFEDAKSAAVQKMLDRVLGKGKTVVRVNAELNFDSSDTTSKTYVTQSGISPISRATSSESLVGAAPGVGGNLGQTFPSLTPGVGIGAAGSTYVKVEETVNNPVGEVVNRTTAAPGTIRRLTVAVVLDSSAKADAARVKSMVVDAVGAQEQARGDNVTVETMDFDTAAAAAAAAELKQAEAAARTAQYLDLGKKAGLGLLVVIVALLAMRRRRKQAAMERARIRAVASDLPQPPALLQTPKDEQLAIAAAAHDGRDTDADVLDPSLERELLRDEVAKFVDSQPEEIAAIVQGWLGQRKR
jgi:flagellar M-ring protein FliF